MYRKLSAVALPILLSAILIVDSVAAKRVRPVLIGALNASWGPTPQVVGLRDSLRELGYLENEDFVIGVRFTRGDVTALSAAASELVSDHVDIILVDHEDGAKAARKATAQIPIVSTALGDPVVQGLIQSLSKPGGNLTGVTDSHLALGPKRLEVFHLMLPQMKRILFLYGDMDRYAMTEAKALQRAATHLGVALIAHAVRSETEAQIALAELRKHKIDGVLAPRCCALNLPELILQATARLGLPVMYESAFWVDHGALASYGVDLYASGRMAGRLVDKIIKGTSPAEIPVEVNPDVEFVINLKAARTLGLELTPEATYRANRFVQ
jgi:putative ABC transport system substrate-binding protein